MPRPARPETLDRLKAIVGPAGFSVDPDELAPHLVEWRNRFVGKTPLQLSSSKAHVVGIYARGYAPQEVKIAAGARLTSASCPRGEIRDWSAARFHAPKAMTFCWAWTA